MANEELMSMRIDIVRLESKVRSLEVAVRRLTAPDASKAPARRRVAPPSIPANAKSPNRVVD